MKLSVYTPQKQAMSFKIITENVCNYLHNYGIKILFFDNVNEIPAECDLIWNPNTGGGYISEINRNNTNKPIVITLHGARLFSLKINELKTKNLSATKILRHRFRQKQLWRKHKNDFEKIITVSEYSKVELIKYLGLEPDKIIPVYNAINHDEFRYFKTDRNYFLHISEYQPVKNLDRIIKAYIKATEETEMPDFWIVSRNFSKKYIHPKIKILENKYRTTKEIVELYQNSYAFLFLSLHEGFGIPIIEAMACGSPVITSNITACPEVADESALLVNPKNVNEIKNAIIKLATDKNLYIDLQKKGLQRAEFFNWEKTANDYYKVFKSALNEQ